MKDDEVIKILNTNLVECGDIDQILPITNGRGDLIGLQIIMSDSVRTKLEVCADTNGNFIIELSQLANIPTYKTFLDTSIPF